MAEEGGRQLCCGLALTWSMRQPASSGCSPTASACSTLAAQRSFSSPVSSLRGQLLRSVLYSQY
jgi:hypothetical protein